jgi:hypothetical protein
MTSSTPASVNGLVARIICTTRIDAAAQLRAKFFGNVMSIETVTNDLGADENDQLGAGDRFVLV